MNNDLFNILRALETKYKPANSQRKLAKKLGFSLGKLNYCLKALQEKGLVKIQNFQNNPDKINYIQYVVTPRGVAERTKLTINFMKRKMKEYDELKKELERKIIDNYEPVHNVPATGTKLRPVKNKSPNAAQKGRQHSRKKAASRRAKEGGNSRHQKPRR